MNRLLLVIVFLIVAGAVLLSTLGSDAMHKMQSGFLGIVAPFVKTGSAVQRQIGEMGSGLKNLDELEAEYNRLTVENRELRTENQLLRDIEAENNKLRQALEYRERSVFKLLPARVISRDGSTWWSTIKINRGFEDGVEVDEPVLTDAGLVGKTTTVAKNESIVLLITDETCKVAGKVEGSREQGILSGVRVQQSDTPGLLQMDFLSKQANLQPGQKIYSAGVSNGVFPSGIPIGVVKSFQVRALDGRAIVEPAVDTSMVEDVFVIVGAK
ncbi:rod shape-determining protein MreC [Terrimicrobium sacchariphilum]|jgi:rod shape-determining protein MreC|uniref:Cell shape-determining protein MreC n=1 Tax=Terrimicrobium sacchariphilum TaxID=690879 RepID=A0A146G4V1_TERSA|nr:rod shape-determining protein MreC [Terrimicrobium sacchariphilum]GAT32047.1 rod shape-determining protein MreC [Terrimicrobium sacchariphilum]